MRIESQGWRAAGPPTAELDPEWDFGAFPIVALMTWPKSARRQAEAHATWAAQMMGFCDNAMPELLSRGLHDALEAVAQRMGVTPAEVLSMPHAREVFREVERLGHAINAEFRERVDFELFRPAGGFQMVAAAPGADALSAEMMKAATGGAFACGLRLVVVACLAEFHPELSASLNRADAVLEAWERETKMTLPCLRTIKDAWKEWGGVAPVWAAVALLMVAAAAGTADPPNVMARMLTSVAGRRTIIAWAKWFRRFAVEHTPPGAAKPLLADHEAVRIGAAVPEEMPRLEPLSAGLYQAAARYRAPKSIW